MLKVSLLRIATEEGCNAAHEQVENAFHVSSTHLLKVYIMAAKLPLFGKNIGLAEHNDIPRIALVACAAFYRSPKSLFQRSDRKKHPNDTIKTYRNPLQLYMSNPGSILLATTDNSQDDENNKTCSTPREVDQGLKHLRN
jgi:hypothetical protein